MSTTRTAAYSTFEKPWASVVLTKPDVTFLVVITTVAGFYLASPARLDWALLIRTASRHYARRRRNRRAESIRRARYGRDDAPHTAARPLPTGLLQPREVLLFGFVTIVIGAAWLALTVNLLSSLLALATTVLYLGLYTPLKTHYPLATAVGAFRRDPATHRLGRGSWLAFRRSLGSFWTPKAASRFV